MNILITGFPGTGKSRPAKELKARGHSAYDPQSMRGYMHVQDRETGKNIRQPKIVPKGWFDAIGSYNWDPIKLKNLLDSSNLGDMFICSMAHNQKQLIDYFDKVFVLTLDVQELTQRLKNRAGDTIGKVDSELADILSLHEHFERSLIEHGATGIDAAQPPEEIIDFILSELIKK